MTLPKFKDYLTNQILFCIFSESPVPPTPGNIALYKKDISFEISPNVNMRDSMDNYKKCVQDISTMNKNITEDKFINVDFAIKIEFSMYSFAHSGVPLTSLILLGKMFNTKQIFVAGDGADYQLSEMTSDHSSEIIVTIIPENKRKILEQYKEWYDIELVKKDIKNKSPKP